MSDEKIFQDVRTQMYILRSRGVIIKNKKRAKQLLLKNNYYNIINGYKQLFIAASSPRDLYKAGTKFEEIYALFDFDSKLRHLTLNYLLKIESTIKSVIAYVFSEYHGHKDYLYFENFDSKGRNKYMYVSTLLSSLYSKIHSNIKHGDLSLTHYVDNRDYIPLWVLVNLMSFGDISKFYACMKQSEREEVAKRFKWGLRERHLENFLNFLSAIRNRCAHSERLYSYECYVSLLSNNNIFKYFRYTSTTPKNNYFAVIVSFKYLLSHNEFQDFINELTSLFTLLDRELDTIKLKDVYRIMGLPKTWKKVLLELGQDFRQKKLNVLCYQ